MVAMCECVGERLIFRIGAVTYQLIFYQWLKSEGSTQMCSKMFHECDPTNFFFFLPEFQVSIFTCCDNKIVSVHSYSLAIRFILLPEE